MKRAPRPNRPPPRPRPSLWRYRTCARSVPGCRRRRQEMAEIAGCASPPPDSTISVASAATRSISRAGRLRRRRYALALGGVDEARDPLLLVAGAQALDDRLLGGKGAVEVAGAHAGGLRDILHRGGVKTVLDEDGSAASRMRAAPLGAAAAGSGKGQQGHVGPMRMNVHSQ